MGGMRYQPQGRPRINTAHPLAAGLVEVLLPGVSTYSALSGKDSSSVAKGGIVGASQGVGFMCTSVGRRYSTTMWSGLPFAWLVVAHRGNSSANCSIVRKDGAGTPMQEWDGLVRAAFFTNGGSYAGVANYGAVANYAGRTSTFCGVVSPGEKAIFSNGGPNVAVLPSEVVAGNGTAPFSIGAAENGSEIAANWAVLAVFAWQGAQIPTIVQLRALEANPWQLFLDESADDDAPAWRDRAVYALNAAVGAFDLAAQGALLRAARRLPAVAGSLVVGGALAALMAARRVTWRPGEFNVGAGAVQVRAARRLAAAASSAGLVTTPVSMFASRKLPAAVGALAAVGQAGSLRAARRLAGITGALSLVGRAISMVYSPAEQGQGYTLATDAGAFGLAGADAALHAHRRLANSPAAMTLAAAVVRIVFGRKLASAPAGFALQTASVTLRGVRRVPADPAVFGFEGRDAQLRYSGQINYASAPAGPGYTPQRHYNESRPAATSSPRPAAIQRNSR
ncbi:hypothetical protein [Massilia sp. TN1-12]|uniref:hypothetical protein n=1 Tax=Massilia paldalensis TaxID=3377675 RepID=UPI00384C6110